MLDAFLFKQETFQQTLKLSQYLAIPRFAECQNGRKFELEMLCCRWSLSETGPNFRKIAKTN